MRRMSVIARALFACIAVPLAARALADAPGESFLVAPSGDGNLRNSEGDIVDLDGGDLLLAWSEFYGGGADEAAARIAAKVSSDQGKTWGDRFVLQENIGAQNVMSVSFLKSESGAPGAAKKGDIFFFYLKKDSNADLTVWHRRLLAREGPTSFKWTEPKSLPTDPGYHVMNNDRVIETKKGRILAPIAYTRDIGKDYNGQTVRVYFSDDGCQTWRRNKEDVALRDDSGKISPAMEPGLIELADGRLLMIIRTRLDRIFKSYSADAGETWSPAEPMALVSPAAPASIARIPTTGDLLMIWNNVAAGSKASWSQRNPLTAAVSHDDGLTWDFTRDIDTESGASFAYTSVLFSGETAILSYYRQTGKPERLDLRLRRVPIGWFYDRSVGQSDPGK